MYIMQTDIERISNDRLQRFISRYNEELKPSILDSTTVMEFRDFVMIGEFALVIKDSKFLFGQIVKFKKFGTKFSSKKSDEIFKFWAYYFDINEKVEFLMHPIYEVRSNGTFVEIPSKEWWRKEQYKMTLNQRFINFETSLLADSISNNLMLT